MVGKAMTATPFVSGMGASFSVASVTSPRVPSDPTKSEFRLYPADDFLNDRSFQHLRRVLAYLALNIPWPTSSLHDCPISQNNGEIDDPVLHRAVAHSICPTVWERIISKGSSN